MKQIARYIPFFIVILLGFMPVEAKQKVYHLDIAFSKHDFCDTIPIIYDDGQIYMDIMVDGQKRRFNLDTGAGQGALYGDWSTVELNGLGNVVSHDAAGNDDTVRVVRMPKVCLPGGLAMDGYVATVYDATVGRKYDGVLGFDFFNCGLSAKIDVKARHIIVTDRKYAFASEQGYTLKYRLKWFVPYVRISPFVRHVDETLFDTGFRQLYTMNDRSFKVHSYQSRHVMEQVTDSARGAFAIGNQGAEKMSMMYFMKLNRLEWGNFRFRDVAAMTTQGSSKLGAKMLEYGSIVVDPKHKKLTFVPYSGIDNVVVANTLPTLAFVPIGGRPAIGMVARHSDAYKAGVRSGDIIMSVDGNVMTSFADFLSFPFISGRENVFLMQSRKGRIKEVRLKRK